MQLHLRIHCLTLCNHQNQNPMKNICLTFLLILSLLSLKGQVPGSVDNTFGNLGRIIFQLPDTYADLGGMKKSSDGKIYICGTHGSVNGSMGFVA